MATIDVGALFRSQGLGLTLEVPDGEAEEPLGSREIAPARVSLRPGGGSFNLLDSRVALTTEGMASLEVSFPSSLGGLDPWGTGEPPGVPPDCRPGLLQLDARLDTGANATFPAPAAWTLTARAAALGRFHYGRLLPVLPGEKLGSAVVRLVSGTRPANRVSPSDLLPGEVQWMTGKFGLDFGVDVNFGRDFELSAARELFGGLPSRFEAHVELVLKAALGLALYDDLSYCINRYPGDGPRPVRVRIQRAHERSLTLGATLALKATYDLGSGLTTLLNHILGLTPVAHALAALREVGVAAGDIAEGKWDAVKAGLAREAGDTLDRLLVGTGWREWLADDPRVQKLVAFSARVVEEYDALDDRLRGWWEEALTKAGLGESSRARAVLEEVAVLQPEEGSYLRALLGLVARGDQGKSAVELLELLTGSSLEGLLIGRRPEVEDAIGRAVEEAGKASRFLLGADEELASRLEHYCREAGVEGVVAWLAENATSVQKLQSALDKRMRELVSRLVDKAWEALDEDDCRRLRALAVKLQAALDASEEWIARLQRDLARLQGELGVSIAGELARVCRTTAVLDVDVAPAACEVAGLWQALAAGNLREVVDELLALDANGPEAAPADPPWLLRECLFTAQRLRTSTVSEVLSFLGLARLAKRELRTVGEARVRIVQDPSTHVACRRGSYSGTITRTETRDGVFQAAVSYEFTAAASAGGIEDPYEVVEAGVRLEVFIDEPKIEAEEIEGLARLIADLNLVDAEKAAGFLAPVPLGARVRLTAALALSPAPVEALLGPMPTAAVWCADIYEAGRRWLGEPLVTASEATDAGRPLRDLLAALVGDPAIQSVLVAPGKAEPDLRTLLAHGWNVRAGRKTVPVFPVTNAGAWNPNYAVLGNLMWVRHNGLRAMRRAKKRLDEAGRSPRALALAAWSLAEALRISSPPRWFSPLFAVWFVRQRLATAKKALEGDGFASLRWELGNASGGPYLLRCQA